MLVQNAVLPSIRHYQSSSQPVFFWVAILGKAVFLGMPVVGFFVSAYLLMTGRLVPLDVVLGLFYFLGPGLGITMGFHRLATHGAFQTNKGLAGILLILGSMAGEGSVKFWVLSHTLHHWNSDDEGDPHSPWYGWFSRFLGLFYSHVGWLFNPNDVSDFPQKDIPELLKQPFVVWVNRLFPVWMVLYFTIPLWIQGTNGTWLALAAAFYRYNITFSVNSVCHRWGSQPFYTGDHSKNNWIVGILGLGEGWHNNHHAFPRSAYHGLAWWQFDLTGGIVHILKWLGLVWEVNQPAQDLIRGKLAASAKLKLAGKG